MDTRATPKQAATTAGGGTFRADLNGLRGLAVLLVAVYHIWVGRVSGGVDVFLLMSAYFLVGAWVRGVERGRRRTVVSSWLKRLRGLLPCAALTILAVLGAGWFLLPQTRWPALLDQAWASLSYTQNLYLAEQSVDYYNADHSSSSPLQHFWSLSVQGQVFLVWPLVLAGTYWVLRAALTRRARREPGLGDPVAATAARYRTSLIVVFCAIFLASFVFSVWFTQADQSRAYFSTPARLWEFALGSLLALVVERLHALPVALSRALGWLGLMALLTCGALLQVEGQFPGYAALWPTLAAACIIVAGAGGRRQSRADVGWWLSRPVAGFVGNISYPLYLWHWPLLIFTLAVVKDERPTWTQGAAILAAALLLAWVTHRWVETPVAAWASQPFTARPAWWLRLRSGLGASRRRGTRALQRAGLPEEAAVGVGAGVRGLALRTGRFIRQHVRQMVVIAVCTLVVVPLGVSTLRLQHEEQAAASQPAKDNPGALSLESGFVDEVDPTAQAVPVPAKLKDDWASVGEDCTGEWALTDPAMEHCRQGGPGDAAVTVVLVGDSHAQQWSPALDVAAQEHGWRWVLVNRPGCRYGSTEEEAAEPACAAFNVAARQYVLDRAKSIDAVLTVGTKTAFYAPSADITTGSLEKIVPGYVDAIEPWLAAGLRVVGIRDTPRFAYDPAECSTKRVPADEDCTRASSQLLAPSNLLEPLAHGPHALPGFATIDLDDVVCPDGMCVPTVGNVNVWMDNSHVTASFSVTMGQLFEQRLVAALGWRDGRLPR